MHKESDGLFDITVMPLVSLWGFGPKKIEGIPDSLEVKVALKTVGMDKLKLRGKTLKKKVKGVGTFKVLVQRPEQNSQGEGYILNLNNKSVTTSGSYEKFRKVKDYRFSHHMDPKTGYPLKSQTISVTVVANSAMEADAYDNIFMAMKPKDAISFANSKNIIDIYLMYLEDGQVKEAQSSGFQKYLLAD